MFQFLETTKKKKKLTWRFKAPVATHRKMAALLFLPIIAKNWICLGDNFTNTNYLFL